MPTSTYTPLANTTLGTNSTSITFSAFSSTAYNDFVIVVDSAGGGGTNNFYGIRFNGDTGNNYQYVQMYGNGSGTGSQAGDNNIGYIHYGAYISGSNEWQSVIHILDYAKTNKHKVVLARGDAPAQQTSASATRWKNTAAITSITLVATVGAFASGSTFALYGVSA